MRRQTLVAALIVAAVALSTLLLSAAPVPKATCGSHRDGLAGSDVSR